MHNQADIDHLFRHHYGRMVSVLTRIFGLEHMETIEDSIQDTFQKAVTQWTVKQPVNPTAWLTLSAKNRVIDILRKFKNDSNREALFSGTSSIAIQEQFFDDEINDSQLRMIFAACHPLLAASEQIAFALKTISGFTTKEIAAALLLKEETIKKRLVRARLKLKENKVDFEIPGVQELRSRIERVHDVIYAIFNEGYHSSSDEDIIRKDLIEEAVRLCKLVLDKKLAFHHNTSALMALMSFHMARIDSRISADNTLLSLEKQDRSIWSHEYIFIGNKHMMNAVETNEFCPYHYEAAIAAEHLRASSFDKTNWKRILMWYEQLLLIKSNDFIILNMSIVHLQLGNYDICEELADSINFKKLESREYLFHAFKADYFHKRNNVVQRKVAAKTAIELAPSFMEKEYIAKRHDINLPLRY